MSCFSYNGAADLNSIISSSDSIILSSDSESESSDDEELFQNKKKSLGKRKNTLKTKQVTKKQKISNTTEKTINNPILNSFVDLLSDSEDDIDTELEFTSSHNLNITNALSSIESSIRLVNQVKTSKNRYNINLDDSPVTTPKKKSSSITVNIICFGQETRQVKLKVSMTDTFDKILDVLSNVLDDVEIDLQTKMKLDGMPLGMKETPQTYSMNDGDEIKVYLSSYDESIPIVEPISDGYVKLSIRNKDDISKFSIKKTDTFQKLFDGYCNNKNIDPHSICFIFDGDELDLTLTPEDEDMEDDDIIDVK